MQKFTEFVKARETAIEEANKSEIAAKYNELYEAKLKEMGAKTPLDLSEEDSQVFFEYLKNLKEQLKTDKKKEEVEVEVKGDGDTVKVEEEKEVTDEKSFREYATNVLKKAHGDDFDQSIADKVIDGIVDKVGKDGDWGQAIGRLTSGLGK